MTRKELRGKSNEYLGEIEIDNNGKQIIRDKSNTYKGSYDPRSDETRDAKNALVGKGNLLTMLL